ncbi:zinc finger BED domain-containing protein RICESLEEPER 2-like [Salvia miltiorrhiza]|uniref:zinc finger BED domain-containing protein RICESLEEPER 2-like n=1 Tax=Salvia miltiorrhiza TaxID=226208 RepID=UPI0025AC4667|nr:zinc finger BED domain-containing protein RICESLEEPER 2-like [Salvia miltiorrhiza]
MVKILKTRLDLQNALLCKGDYFHVRCCAHILNIIVQEGLKVASDALDKIRASVKYVKASEARMIKFKECARKIGIELTSSLCLDVPTRWNSTYLMLDSGIKYRKVFCMLAFDDLIARLLEVNARSKDKVVKSISLAMQSRFEKYWEEYSDIISKGAVFDPRMKLKLLEYCYSKIDPISSSDKINILKMKLHVLYDEYKRKGVGEYKSYKGGTSDSKSLLDIYLEEAPINEKVEIDLHMYWKDNASRFGELARMACDVLSIPITTVASEYSFSTVAHVLNKYRNRFFQKEFKLLFAHVIDGEDDEQEDMGQVEAPNVINVEEECYSNV